MSRRLLLLTDKGLRVVVPPVELLVHRVRCCVFLSVQPEDNLAHARARLGLLRMRLGHRAGGGPARSRRLHRVLKSLRLGDHHSHSVPGPDVRSRRRLRLAVRPSTRLRPS